MYEDMRYKPLSPWAYFGYSVLFSLPLIGFVFLLVFSFSNRNINRRNFARSYFCFLLILVIVLVVFTAIYFVFPKLQTVVAGFFNRINLPFKIK